MGLADLIDRELGDIEAPDVTLEVTHQALEGTTEVDQVQQALLQMLAAKDLLPPSDSADLAGYPGLTSQS